MATCVLPPRCIVAFPKREHKKGLGLGEACWLLTVLCSPVSPAPAQQGQALQVSQLLPGLLGLRVPADPPLSPRHQARQGVLLQHVRAGLHLGECLLAPGPPPAPQPPPPLPQSCTDSPHFPDKETEAQRREVTTQDHSEWQSQGFCFPVLFGCPCSLVAFLAWILRCGSLQAQEHSRQWMGVGRGGLAPCCPEPGREKGRRALPHGGKVQPSSWPQGGTVTARSHPQVSERSAQCQKGDPIQSPVPGWEFPKTRASQHPEEGVEMSHLCMLQANQIF